ncbi:MAG: DNA mismatch repair endonuclease MutL [Bacteroidales bacterium]|nr:DNA mismatch repair endonuclease MutL [Bacteroidales bacterium]
MSDIIRLLPDSIANQIAAGEVIQRPSSVVKELVENSVDAGAKTISVIIRDAGKTLIRVLDDGVGMSDTDARMAFERHATSKIKDAADLFNLHSFGFRGEALASIVAIAQVDLRTRKEGQELGIHIEYAGSKLLASESVACPVGCDFQVKNLFFNVPARRKFLKSNDTEFRNILNEFERVVLIHPEIEFHLIHNDIELYTYREAVLKKRIEDVFGKNLSQSLLSLDIDTSLVNVKGFVSTPGFAKKRGYQQYFFVNGRFMKHPYFHKAVLSAFDKIIEPDEMPSYFISLNVDPQTIDVNIHPTKTEIKFENEKAIWQILNSLVRETLCKSSSIPNLDFNQDDAIDIPVYTGKPVSVQPPHVQVNPNYNPFNTADKRSYERETVDWEKLYTPASAGKKNVLPPEDDVLLSSGGEIRVPEQLSLSPEFSPGSTSYFQFRGRYIVSSLSSGLVLIDQHRAHMRILYDGYVANIINKKKVSERLLFPETIEVSSEEALVISSIPEEIEYAGFDLCFLGNNTYSINALPSGIEPSSAAALLKSMLHNAIEVGCEVQDEIVDAIAMSLAKAAAIPYNKILSGEEMDYIVASLFASSSPNYTPDGKNVLITISDQELRNRFK